MRSMEKAMDTRVASATELAARIQHAHGPELKSLLADLTSPSDHRSGRRLHRLGPVPSMEDATIKLTLVAEAVELGWFAPGPAPSGTCVTLSLAAHHEETGLHAEIPADECEAWVRALVGHAWMRFVYRCECSAGPASASVDSYRLYLDSFHRPAGKPVEVPAEGCRPLDG